MNETTKSFKDNIADVLSSKNTECISSLHLISKSCTSDHDYVFVNYLTKSVESALLSMIASSTLGDEPLFEKANNDLDDLIKTIKAKYKNTIMNKKKDVEFALNFLKT